MNHDGTPKVPPITAEAATDDQRAAMEPLGPMGELNIFRMLAIHPKLLRSWLPFGGRLLQGSSLSPRHRELVILRTAGHCGSGYEWGQHVGIGRDAGLTDEEIVACAGPLAGGWSDEDRAVLQGTDELLSNHRIADGTWDALVAAGWSDAQLVELTMLAGHYAMLAGMLNSIGVETEIPLPAIGSAGT